MSISSSKVKALQAAARVRRHGGIKRIPALQDDGKLLLDYVGLSASPEDCMKNKHEMPDIEKHVASILEGFSIGNAAKSSIRWSVMRLIEELCQEIDTLKHTKPKRHAKKVF